MEFLLFGILQGLAEFLPISSSGHLFLLKRLAGIKQDLLSFFVFLHLATILAIAVFLFKEMRSVLHKRKLLLHLFLISVITAGAALLIREYLIGLFENKYIVSLSFFINALILLKIGKAHRQKTDAHITLKDSFVLGLLQGFAVFPGISRAGITIAGLLKRDFKEEEAFTLSFLMAIPVTIGAFILECKGLTAAHLPQGAVTLGFALAFFSGLFALKILKKSLLMLRFRKFAYYCIAVSLLGLML